MKIRTCFVSNSSSSSFLVKNFDLFSDKKQKLTKEQIKKLEDFGFVASKAWSVTEVEFSNTDNIKYNKGDKDFKYPPSYIYSITCNQDDVIEWLVYEKIPFQALCHYGDYVCIFDGEKVYRIENYGLEILTSGPKEFKKWFPNFCRNKNISINDIIIEEDAEVVAQRYRKTFDKDED